MIRLGKRRDEESFHCPKVDNNEAAIQYEHMILYDQNVLVSSHGYMASLMPPILDRMVVILPV
eukprot:scaffold586_cov209-Ochromonas_danica.AAC.1